MLVSRVSRWSVIAVLLVRAPSAAAFAQAPAPASAPASADATAGRQALADARAEVDRLKQELAAMREQYDKRLADLEQRLTAMAAAPPAAPEPAGQSAAAAAAAGPGASKVFNPDTSVIGNFVGVGGKNPQITSSRRCSLAKPRWRSRRSSTRTPAPTSSSRPSPEGLESKKASSRSRRCRRGLLLKVGKMRAQFGKVNTLHTHALPTGRSSARDREPRRRRRRAVRSRAVAVAADPEPVVFLEVDRRGLPGNSDGVPAAQRSRAQLRGRGARLPRHHRGHEPRPRRLVRLRADGGPNRSSGAAGRAHAAPVGLRRDVPVSPASPRHLPPPRWRGPSSSGAARNSRRRGHRPRSAIYGLGEYQFARRWYAGRPL